MVTILEINNLSKRYSNGFNALEDVSLTIERGEIFALLGHNGAGKSTLISIICGITRSTAGQIIVDGIDAALDPKKAKQKIGLVPQELSNFSFNTVWDTVSYTRGLYGKPPSPQFIEGTLRKLSLWDVKDHNVSTLSGGMKRRVLIAKALSHQPEIIFLDEPTAGVDVDLRRNMWQLVNELRDQGVTIILTTHYIEEAEQMADRIGIIDRGKIKLVETKSSLINKFGQVHVQIGLKIPIDKSPLDENIWRFTLTSENRVLNVFLDNEYSDGEITIADLLKELAINDIDFRSVDVKRSSLEDIFIGLIGD